MSLNKFKKLFKNYHNKLLLNKFNKLLNKYNKLNNGGKKYIYQNLNNGGSNRK